MKCYEHRKDLGPELKSALFEEKCGKTKVKKCFTDTIYIFSVNVYTVQLMARELYSQKFSYKMF